MQAARWFRCLTCLGVSGFILGVAMAGQACPAEEPAKPTKWFTPWNAYERLGDDYLLTWRAEHGSKYWLGFEFSPASGALAAQLDLPEGKRLVVDKVFEASPAAKAGLKQYDVLLSLDGTPLAEIGDLAKALDKAAGKESSLEVLRRGKKETIRVTPTAKANVTTTGSNRLIIKAPDPSGAQRLVEYVVTQPLVAAAAKPVEFPKDLKVVITKQGEGPAEVLVTRGDKVWKATDKTLEQLPEDVRKPIQQLLGQSAGVQNYTLRAQSITLDPSQGRIVAEGYPQATQAYVPTAPVAKVWPPPAPRESLQQRLDEIARRLEAIEKALKEKR